MIDTKRLLDGLAEERLWFMVTRNPWHYFHFPPRIPSTFLLG